MTGVSRTERTCDALDGVYFVLRDAYCVRLPASLVTHHAFTHHTETRSPLCADAPLRDGRAFPDPGYSVAATAESGPADTSELTGWTDGLHFASKSSRKRCTV